MSPAESELRRLKASFRNRLARFDELLLSDVPLARQALRKLILGHIEFRPVERDGERGYDLRWSLVTKALLDGNIGVASPRGGPNLAHALGTIRFYREAARNPT